jgi:hypothetical protein
MVLLFTNMYNYNQKRMYYIRKLNVLPSHENMLSHLIWVAIGDRCNYLESDNEREIEKIKEENGEENTKLDIVNPGEDIIRNRMTQVADDVKEFGNMYEKTRMTVRKELEEIVNLGKNKYEMEPIHLRNLIIDTFEERGASLRYLRRLLPDVMKFTSRIPLTTIQRQQQKQQQKQQVLLLRKQETGPEVTNINAESTEINLSPTVMQTTATDDSYTLAQGPDKRTLEEELRRAHAEIKTLQETFLAKAFLKFRGKLIPIVATIDPLKKVIISVKAKW